MSHAWGVPLAAAGANLACAVVVARRGQRDRAVLAFTAMAVTFACWNLTLCSLLFFTDEAQAAWWSSLFRLGLCFAPAATFHAASALAGNASQPWRGLLWCSYAAGLGLAAANLAGRLVLELRLDRSGWHVVPTPLYGTISLLWVACLLLSGVIMARRYLEAGSAWHRTQAKLFFLALATQLPIVALSQATGVPPLVSLGSVVWVGILAYATGAAPDGRTPRPLAGAHAGRRGL